MQNGLAIVRVDPGTETWTLDRSSPLPLYAQIKQRLLTLIAAWDRPEDRFFTDEQLCRRFGVNRLTVRQAVQSLVEDGLLVRARGSGTVLRREKIEEHFSPRMNFLDEWAARGLNMRAEALADGIGPASEEIARALGLSVGEDVVHIQRRRLAGQVPVSVDERYLPADLGADITARDVETLSLLDILRRRVKLHHCDMQVEALAAAGDRVRLLNVMPGEALLARRLTYFDTNGRAVMTGHSFHRAGLVCYAMQIALEPATAAARELE